MKEQRNKGEKDLQIYKNNAVLNDSALWMLEGPGKTTLSKVQYHSLIEFPSKCEVADNMKTKSEPIPITSQPPTQV